MLVPTQTTIFLDKLTRASPTEITFSDLVSRRLYRVCRSDTEMT